MCNCIKKLESERERLKGLEEKWWKKWNQDRTSDSLDTYVFWLHRRKGADAFLEALQDPQNDF